ncbi:MAG TPA: FAD-binding oxidoreductase [Gemmatimonadaceae bacterium]|nr:FAD-binding oxidoreductase [Gemmatimonadaceae bacterium]
MTINLSNELGVRAAYEADASGIRLVPEFVARPESIEEVAELLKRASTETIPVTCAGAQTSTTAASISDKGILMSLRALDRISPVDEDTRTMTVGPGALVGEIKRAAAAHGLLFAPDPTSEEESTIGGAIACNASGARTFKYGATRRHVARLKVVLANGDVVDLHRTNLEKNTVGYAFAHDPIDWFIGSEGTLGVIVEAELTLLPLPQEVAGIAVFFGSEGEALRFVVDARESRFVTPRCIEYFDDKAMSIARAGDQAESLPRSAMTMVYVEEEIDRDLDTTLGNWLNLIESAGTDLEPIVFDGEGRLKDARRLRHSIPSTMNERGSAYRDNGGRKVSTDWAVPYRSLADAIRKARFLADESGIDQAVIYGHAGNGHPHQNFIARDSAELATIERVVEETLREVIRLGGTVAAEHGIGKIKRKWLPLQMNPLQIAMMTAVKKELDPLGILAPGNIL